MNLDVNFLKDKFISCKKFNLDEIIKFAYKDLQLRTIKGHDNNVATKCCNYLRTVFEEIVNNQNQITDFNKTHESLCDGFLRVINAFVPKIEEQKYGKAQKVINIIIKFLVAHNVWGNEDNCHTPIDSYVLRWLYNKDNYNGKSWSNLDKADYIAIQNDILDKIKYPIKISNIEFRVKNRIEVDFYVWHITRVKENYNNVKKSMKTLIHRMQINDTECIDKEMTKEILLSIEILKNKIEKTFK